MKKTALYLALLGALSGCATTTPRGPGPGDDPTLQCLDSSLSDPRLSVLLPKVGAMQGTDGVTMTMLADQSKPSSAAELDALKLWGDIRIRCVDAGRSFRHQYAPPEWNAIFNRLQTGVVLATARLYAGEITYGQFNSQRQQLAQEADAAMAAGGQRSADRAAQQEAAESAAAIQMMQHQQILNRMRPVR